MCGASLYRFGADDVEAVFGIGLLGEELSIPFETELAGSGGGRDVDCGGDVVCLFRRLEDEADLFAGPTGLAVFELIGTTKNVAFGFWCVHRKVAERGFALDDAVETDSIEGTGAEVEGKDSGRGC